ncbi:MAG: hypothetical protein IIA76_00935 [Proteobacteria bacterium]|nr:hypothetical protein [Pseudomonadota bacterium]
MGWRKVMLAGAHWQRTASWRSMQASGFQVRLLAIAHASTVYRRAVCRRRIRRKKNQWQQEQQ